MALRVKWDRTPVSIHHDNKLVLEGLILHLRNKHGLRRRSIVMEDREEGPGFLFFLYQPCDPRWITEFDETQIPEEE
ncbi:MAG: hypothetical protein QNL85_08210 [Euryarchaeota archaeon]|tara:strand:+ start:1053 stop:1283 length:231 start_codon:yes stop_codon:yes gene_type:complete